ncbi:MAG: nuclease-related domain-containing protein [Clostridium paraputrificum]|uniref:nuclease-related domain-containing protein n=1 Tax=Clostridium sp. TaxID=1506 RepID=UPI0025C5330C|nr:nuclease-related domain-containing protein [Clostridium sp.]MBS5928324.1 NERD domain-containing protein [Clostridium sp.]
MGKRNIPGKYNYLPIELDLNEAHNFLEKEINELESFKIDLLLRYKEHFNKDIFKNNADILLILADINRFLYEYNFSLDHIYKDYRRLKKGVQGEEKVRDVIYSLVRKNKVISNARLVIRGTSIENDFLIINEGGVYTVEVKNIGSYKDKLLIDEYGRLTRINSYGEICEQGDILSQANRHVEYLEQFLNKEFNYKIPIHSYIVIASSIKVVNKSEFNILGVNQLQSSLLPSKKFLNKDQVERVYTHFMNNVEKSKKYPFINYKDILYKNYRIILSSIVNVTS